MENKTYKIVELNAVLGLLSKCKNDKDLKSASTALTGIRLTKQIDKLVKKHGEEQQELLKSFDLTPMQNANNTVQYDWTNEPSDVQAKIKASLDELEATEYKVDGFNTIDAEEFIIYTRGLDNLSISFLYSFLVKDAD